jgi:hypothetical protein
MAGNGKVLNPAQVNAEYWASLITRDEFQKVMDEQDEALSKKLVEFEMFLRFLLERMQVRPEEFGAWLKAKAAIIEGTQDEGKVTLD